MDPTQFLILDSKLNAVINDLGLIYSRLEQWGLPEATSSDYNSEVNVKSFDPREIPTELQQMPGEVWRAVCLTENQLLCNFNFFFVAQQFGEVHRQITGHLYKLDLKI